MVEEKGDEKMSMIKEQKKAIATMAMGDWGLVKLGCIVFGILLAYFYPPMRFWLDWYWWVILAFLLVVPVYMKWSKVTLSKSDIAKLRGDGLGQREWMQIKKSNSLWDWGLVKTCCMLLGIAIVSYRPQLIYEIEWYYIAAIFLILIGAATYLIYIYKAPKQNKKGRVSWR